MLSNFHKDLEKGKIAESIVREVFASLTSDYRFEDVSNDFRYFYMGDIKAVSAEGKEIFIEVKNDSRIHQTGNILCEDEVYYKQHGYYSNGNMHCKTDIFVVVSIATNKIYVIDFKVLKNHYREGRFLEIDYPQQSSLVYLLPISRVKQLGGLIAEIDYGEILLKEVA